MINGIIRQLGLIAIFNLTNFGLFVSIYRLLSRSLFFLIYFTKISDNMGQSTFSCFPILMSDNPCCTIFLIFIKNLWKMICINFQLPQGLKLILCNFSVRRCGTSEIHWFSCIEHLQEIQSKESTWYWTGIIPAFWCRWWQWMELCCWRCVFVA